MDKIWAVIGGGNGGQAFAGHLAMLGKRVRLHTKSESKAELLRKTNSIVLKNDINGVGKLELISTDVEEVVRGADNIAIVLPSSWHELTAKMLIPCLVDGQSILLLPEASCGAIAFRRMMTEMGCTAKVVVGAAGTLPYTTRLIDEGVVNIIMFKNEVEIAALPATDNQKLKESFAIDGLNFHVVENTLRTSIDNINLMVHAAPTLLNVARIEAKPPQDYEYYREGMTPTICDVLEKMDLERIAIAEALGLKQRSLRQELVDMYSCGSEEQSLYELFQNCRSYNGIMAPKTLRTRTVMEDVPFSLVPISALGRITNVPTPTIDTIISLGKLMIGAELQTGRTAERLGIAGLNKDALIKLVSGE